VAGGPTYYKLFGPEIIRQYHRCLANGDKPDSYYVSEQVPEHVEQSIRLQGEVILSSWGYELTYSTVKKPMRDALREETLTARGLGALMLLRGALDAEDFDWLEVLLRRYSGHVVEFSAHGHSWGTLHRPMVVWEVRSY
jgi:hypothetical protein